MVRDVRLLIAPLLLATLAGCGSLGLDPAYDIEEGTEAGDYDELDQVDVPLTDRTYAAPMADIRVLQPSGLDTLLHDNVSGALLFHVADEDLDRLSIMMTMGDEDGRQDPCVAVYSLPEADWTTNPEFAIEGGRTEIEIGSQPVSLTSLSLESVVSSDGAEWETAHIRTLLDTRDLLGGSLSEDTDVCALVENMGGECRECDDGVQACAVLELELTAYEVAVSFDEHGQGGC